MTYTVRHELWGTNWEDVKPGEMVVVLQDGIPVMVDFICPCGCGHTVPTHLVCKSHSGGPPRWEYSPGPTLSPSIRWLSGCKAHFNITNGKAVMHDDSGK